MDTTAAVTDETTVEEVVPAMFAPYYQARAELLGEVDILAAALRAGDFIKILSAIGKIEHALARAHDTTKPFNSPLGQRLPHTGREMFLGIAILYEIMGFRNALNAVIKQVNTIKPE
jgi:hypothetical protein